MEARLGLHIYKDECKFKKYSSTTSAVIRQLNSPESYLVYINENGWLNLGGNQWVYNDPAYIKYTQY